MHTMITLLAQVSDEYGHHGDHVDPLSEYSPWRFAVSNLGVWLILLLLVLTAATAAL